MIALLQRVSEACVEVQGTVVAKIEVGLAVLICVTPNDHEADADALVKRLLAYRVFPDVDGRMNRSLQDVGGGLLLVPQFTLAANTSKGLRPGFSGSAAPTLGRQIFERMVATALQLHRPVETGIFGAHMRLSLTNDGPTTFWMESPATQPST